MSLRLSPAFVPVLLLAACPRLEAPAELAPPLPPATRDDPSDPLREPAELHLAHVRQLSFGGRAGPPLFAAGGKMVAFLVGAADGGTNPRLVEVASGREVPAPAVPAGDAAVDLWQSGSGVCLDARVAACARNCPVASSLPLTAGAACTPPPFPLSRAGGCAVSASGDWACALLATPGPELWLWPKGAPAPRRVSALTAEDPAPTFSPNGQSLAWARPIAPPEGGREAILSIATPPETAPADVGPPEQEDIHPVWFPDGGTLAFCSNADDAAGRDMDLFRMDPDGDELERITFAAGADLWPAIAPDGRRIAWVSERNAAAPGERDVLVADWTE